MTSKQRARKRWRLPVMPGRALAYATIVLLLAPPLATTAFAAGSGAASYIVGVVVLLVMATLGVFFAWAMIGAVWFGVIWLLPSPRWRHADPGVRLAAAESTTDPQLLRHLASHDADDSVRQAAAARLASLS